MAQAAATPKTKLSGTAMPAAIKVSWMALTASGSRIDCEINLRTFFKRFGEDDDQRQNQKKSQEQQRHGDQVRANPTRLADGDGPAL